MADTDILVSEMTPASQINTTDLMIMTQPDAQAETGYTTKSGTVLQVANKMLKGTEYSTDLPDFTDKSVLGGLEELKASIESLFPVDSASGAIATFDTALSRDLVDCTSTIVATGGNGTPDSPIPINGYTEANITANGNTYTIAFGQTIFGGVHDVTRGKLHVTYGGVSATASDLVSGQVYTANNGWAFTLSNKDPLYMSGGNVVSNINIPTAYSIATASGFCRALTGKRPVFFIADSDTGLDGSATLAQIQSAFETFCNNCNPFAVYELATPFDIDLTPVQIEALLGVNNVFSDTNGTTEVKYKDTIQHYIDKKIAETQALVL